MGSVTTSLRAVNTPEAAEVVGLDGGDEMYPLRSADELARITGFSAKYWHHLMANGDIPYVLFPPADPRRGAEQQEGKRRRVRNDHLRQLIEDLTQE